MEIFAHNPKADRETLESFNERLLEYCLKAVVVGVLPSKVGEGLVLSLLTAEELDAPQGTPCVFPAVYRIRDVTDVEIEEHLNAFCSQLVEMNLPDGDPETELVCTGAQIVDGAEGEAWFVVQVTYAVATLGPDEKDWR